MYAVYIISLCVLGFVGQRNQVLGDFINPLHYIRYERAVTQLGEYTRISINNFMGAKTC